MLILLALIVNAAMAPLDVYTRAITAMHAISDPAYLQFDVDFLRRHGRKEENRRAVDFERTSDRRTVVIGADGKVLNRLILPIPPDLFLRNDSRATASQTELSVGLEEPKNQSLKTIASVEVVDVPYTIMADGTEDLPDCAQAIRLVLTPKLDPLKYNVRRLWIDPASMRICRAIAIWRGPVVTHDQDVPVTLDVGRDGMIESWTLTVTARLMFSTYTETQDAYYTDVRPLLAQRWSDLDGKV